MCFYYDKDYCEKCNNPGMENMYKIRNKYDENDLCKYNKKSISLFDF